MLNTNSASNPASQLRPPADGTENRAPDEQHAHYPSTPVSQPNRRSEAARRVWERRRQAQASAAASSNGAQTPNEGEVGFRVTSRELGGADRRSATTSDCFTRLELNQ
ncbi:hypothetical protein DFP72DRAFT_1173828 [Ephemerocybe angulata]|uniref:Uncharacterized protein n=1 Tax=Ephemerocybe angulata TaxID=980116 RepID=A0A8H6M2E2_9AGAR|nr:hypothetical protein DFP72DRAFT_1173828 [Tulosesus angulatus]